MGGTCCVERRLDSLKASESAIKELEEEGIMEKISKPKIPQKKLTLVEIRSAAEEPEPDFESTIDFYWASLAEFFTSWENAFLNAQKEITQSSSGEPTNQPFPYLITSFIDKEEYVMICSRPFPSLYQKQVKKENPKEFFKRYVMKKFTVKTTNEAEFRDELRFFLK